MAQLLRAVARGADRGRYGADPGLCDDGGPAAYGFDGLPELARASLRSSSVLAVAPAREGWLLRRLRAKSLRRSGWMTLTVTPVGGLCQHVDCDSHSLRPPVSNAGARTHRGPPDRCRAPLA